NKIKYAPRVQDFLYTKVYMLDEPTSGLDAESAIHIQKLIKDLQKKGATIFMTSHNLYEVDKKSTLIAFRNDCRT
ncbi:AAA family ATPase, partial [Peribacillus frigoritolerans]|uniref:AAA family ATPase n=1 Tax=Peribacillus frigoritolerans TaxID=450367 RepID=UPI0035D4D569